MVNIENTREFQSLYLSLMVERVFARYQNFVILSLCLNIPFLYHQVGQVRYGSTCDGTSPRSPFMLHSLGLFRATARACAGSIDHSFIWSPNCANHDELGRPADDSTQPDPERLGCGEQDHPLGNVPRGHRSAVGAPVSRTWSDLVKL